jgi:hypothetical protein
MDNPKAYRQQDPVVLPLAEKRQSVRYSCILDASCRSNDAVEYAPNSPAVVLNISTGGVCLMLNERFEPGTLLTIGLQSTAQSFLPPLEVRVVHVVQQANGDWIMGGAFVRPLSEGELQDLLA